MSWLEKQNMDLMKEYAELGTKINMREEEWVKRLERVEFEKARIQGELRRILVKSQDERMIVERLQVAMEKFYRPIPENEKLDVIRKKLGNLISDDDLFTRFNIPPSNKEGEEKK